jgi:uncharacterized membrane protein YkoI
MVRIPLRVATALMAGLLMAGLALPGPAAAERFVAKDSIKGRDHDAARQGVRSGEIISYPEVRRIVQSRYPGQILDTELKELVPGQKVYRVLVLASDGRRITVWVDARRRPDGSVVILRVEG